MSSDPKTVSPTLSSPQERLLETRATGTISIRITHNALERCFKPAATPRSGAKHTWQNKVSLFKLSVALVDLGCPLLAWDTPYMCTSSYLFASSSGTNRSLQLLDPPCFLPEGNKKFGRIMNTLQKSQMLPLLQWDPAREAQSSAGHAVHVLLLPALVWSSHRNSAEPLVPEGSTGQYCRL